MKITTAHEAIKTIKNDSTATGLRSAFELAESPWKMFEIEKGYLKGLRPDDPRPEYYNLPRQSFPPVYNGQGYIYIIRSETVLNKGLTYGEQVIGFISPDCGEVDREEDFKRLEYMMNDHGKTVLNYMQSNYT